MKYFFLLIFIFTFFLLKICNYKKENFKSKYCERPDYEPKKINKNFLINNNCYAYALNNFSDKRSKKTQPGFLSNIPKIKKKKKYYTCENFNHRILKDNKLSYKLEDNEEDCLCDYYKIAFFIDDTENNLDYHFYREEYDHKLDKSFWSHKAGNYIVNNKMLVVI